MKRPLKQDPKLLFQCLCINEIWESGKIQLEQVLIVIAIVTIIMTIFVGILSVVLSDKTQIFDIELGLPLGWFRFYTLSETSFVNIEIFNWLNLIVDLIFYLFLCFGLSSLGEILLKNIKIKHSGT